MGQGRPLGWALMAIRVKGRRSTLLLAHTIRPLSSTPVPPPADDGDEAVISAAVSALRDRRSRSRWNYLRSLFHPTGFSPSQASGVVLRLRNNPRLALRFFLWSHHRRLCHHDLASYAAIVHVLARSRLRSAAFSLLQSAIRSLDSHSRDSDDHPPPIFETLVKTYRACDSAPFVFDLLIRAYLQAKKLDRALQITRLLLSRGIHPLVATSNSLIRSASRARGSDAGLDLYRELFDTAGVTTTRVSPNVYIFNTLLLALYRDARLDASAGFIRGEMERFGCDPNVFTYSVLMAGLCDEWRNGEARKLWEEMVANQIKPDIVAFNTLMGGYCNAGEVLSAEELFREMSLSGIEPTCTTFEHLISGHCRAGDIDAALLVFDDMRRRGHRPEVSTIDEVIEEMCERGRVAEGLGILRDEMRREDGGFCPSRTSYELLIKGFCEEGEIEEAVKLQAEMAGRGFQACSQIYTAFIEGYSKQGDIEKAGRLKDEMVKMIPHKEGE